MNIFYKVPKRGSLPVGICSGDRKRVFQIKAQYVARRQKRKQKKWESFIKLLNLAVASGVWWGQKNKLD